MNIDSILVLAPHQDDELNLAGQLIYSFCKKNKKVYVVYSTNGDSAKKTGNRRMKEAVEACSVLGVPKDRVWFLGYANDWKNNQHIYKSKGELVSAIGKIETSGYKNLEEYCYLRKGIHHRFCYDNFREDLKNVVESIRADLIVCVDYDLHPDHRALSLTFDSVMGEILRNDLIYRPIVLKKYAYNGVWFGKKDYYVDPMPETQCNQGFIYGGQEHPLESPNFVWDERIILQCPTELKTKLLRQNLLYRAARKHLHTTAWYSMQRVINSDVIYWQRFTNNLLYEADLEASSGDVAYLFDFMMYDSDNIMKKELTADKIEYAWRPHDLQKRVAIKFHKPIRVSKLTIYEDFKKENHIVELKISIGRKKFYMEPVPDGSRTCLVLSAPVITDLIEIRIEKWVGSPGIAELEIFNNEQRLNEHELILDESATKNCHRSKFLKIDRMIERFLLMVEFAFRFKIGYEIRRLLKNRKFS